MKYYLIIIILLAITSCGNNVKKSMLNKQSTCDSIAYERFPKYALTNDVDTLFAKIFELKGGYQLMMYPEAWCDDIEGTISYSHCARLVGQDIDTVFMSASTYQRKMWLRYDSLDFDDCFVIEYSGGGSASLYVDVIEKRTARRIVDEQGAAIYNLKNQLILYEAGEIMIYDAKKKVFYEVETPNHPCYGGMGSRFFWNFEKITDKYIYLSHVCDEDTGANGTRVDRSIYTVNEN